MEGAEASFFLKYLPIDVTLKSLGKAELPAFLGSTLRGVIGRALYQDLNAYNYLYRNSILSGGGQDIVNPYIICPPEYGKNLYAEGEELKFRMLFLGEAVQFACQLVHALQAIGRLGLGAARYPFELIKVVHSLDQRVIWKDGVYHKNAIRSAALPYCILPEVKQLQIQMITPLRIRRNGELLDRLEFPTIIRNITNRMEMLTERYGGWVDKNEAMRIQSLSTEISTGGERLKMVSLDRYSNRLGEKMDFSGLMGEIWFEGDLTIFVPWLYAAQVLHIGRNTTFGMGRVEVEFT